MIDQLEQIRRDGLELDMAHLEGTVPKCLADLLQQTQEELEERHGIGAENQDHV